jgi:hypothetical protein
LLVIGPTSLGRKARALSFRRLRARRVELAPLLWLFLIGERQNAYWSLFLSLLETISPGFVGLSGRRVTFLCFAKEK